MLGKYIASFFLCSYKVKLIYLKAFRMIYFVTFKISMSYSIFIVFASIDTQENSIVIFLDDCIIRSIKEINYGPIIVFWVYANTKILVSEH